MSDVDAERLRWSTCAAWTAARLSLTSPMTMPKLIGDLSGTRVSKGCSRLIGGLVVL